METNIAKKESLTYRGERVYNAMKIIIENIGIDLTWGQMVFELACFECDMFEKAYISPLSLDYKIYESGIDASDEYNDVDGSFLVSLFDEAKKDTSPIKRTVFSRVELSSLSGEYYSQRGTLRNVVSNAIEKIKEDNADSQWRYQRMMHWGFIEDREIRSRVAWANIYMTNREPFMKKIITYKSFQRN